MKLQSSLINLTKRGQMKLRDKSLQYDNSYRTKKPYAIYEAEDNLVPYAASHLQSVFNAFNIFESQRVSNTTWFVQRIVDKPESTLIPKFLRLGSVKYDWEKQILHCNCPRSIVYGDICPHVAHVATTIQGYDGPYPTDIGLSWHTEYSHFGFNDNCHGSQSEMNNLHDEMLKIKKKYTRQKLDYRLNRV